ncbi:MULTISPECIES: hypothetical protein [Halorussus]|uniref:hypothetical protein n=1 Tax=Halorussus TaxID=1070314 RepID=UPI00209CAAC8|nr:hypothetical protein [Halorussus vallis]USZ78716.1 hypothetical protein NGM07_24710 [Halorussus vallis]
MSVVPEVTEHELGVQRLYLHDWAEGVDLYKRAGEADSAAVMAAHDGPVLLDGAFRRVTETEYGGYDTFHPHGGRMERLAPADNPTAVLLVRLEGECVRE